MTDHLERIGRKIRQARVSPRYLIPGALRGWIDLPGSMTREIARVSCSPPAVSLRFEGPGSPAPWEAQLLQLNQRRRVWIREISLDIADKAVLMARSVTCISSPVAPMLRGLGHKPLAELLFADPRWQRLQPPLPVCSNSLPLQPAGTLPGRTTVWEYAGKRSSRLLVSEFFLPALIASTLTPLPPVGASI